MLQTYIGLAAEQPANLHRYAYSYLSVVVLSSLLRLLLYYTGGSGFPCFPLPMVPLSLWYSRHSGALAEHCIDTRQLLTVV